MNRADRERFDALFEEVLGALPPNVHQLLEEIPVVLLDRPTPQMMDELRADGTLGPEDSTDDLCGLHSGRMLTERSVNDPADLPTQIHLFREGILSMAGGFEGDDADAADDAVYEEIRITLLHELGHHFGLEEDDLMDLGYD